MTLFQRAKCIDTIEISEIVQITEAANALKNEGHDIISLGTGEPDFDTPDHVKEAAHHAALKGQTKYTAVVGTKELRTAIQDKFKRENNLDFELNQIIVSSGAKQIIYNAMRASLNPGDEVIIPAPYWTTYSDIVQICGATPIVISCPMEHGFKLTPDLLTKSITKKTRWLMLNSPSNPTGALYTKCELQALCEVLKKHPNVWVVADEIYEHLTYAPAEFCSLMAACPEVSDRTLIVNGVSKSYAMTGWRLGYGAGPKELIAAMVAVQGQITSGASSISQAAAIAALNGDQQLISDRCDDFQKRRDYIVQTLNTIPDIDCLTPDGAFYVFPSCKALIGKKTPDGNKINSDADFCQYLLNSVGLAVVPGRAFGLSGHFRISFAYAQTSLEEAMRRLTLACSKLN